MIIDDLHGMTGAYALHALPEDQRVAFERHLAGCETCAEEAAELSATAARLGLAVAVVPDGQIRRRVLSRIVTVRQEAPDGRPVERVGRSAPRSRLLSRWALVACLAAATAFGGSAVWQYQRAASSLAQAQRAQKDAAQISAVLAVPDARTQAMALPGGATAAVVVSRGRNQAVFVVSGMPRAPAHETYQLWFDDDGTMRPAGLMNPGRADQSVLLHGAVDGASGMGITPNRPAARRNRRPHRSP